MANLNENGYPENGNVQTLDEAYQKGFEDGKQEAEEGFEEIQLSENLSFWLERFDEMQDRKLNPSEMRSEIESEWLTRQPTLGLSNKNQSKLF